MSGSAMVEWNLIGYIVVSEVAHHGASLDSNPKSALIAWTAEPLRNSNFVPATNQICLQEGEFKHALSQLTILEHVMELCASFKYLSASNHAFLVKSISMAKTMLILGVKSISNMLGISESVQVSNHHQNLMQHLLFSFFLYNLQPWISIGVFVDTYCLSDGMW